MTTRLDDLLRVLALGDEPARYEATQELARFAGTAVSEPLLRALQDESPRVRAQAAATLGELRILSAIDQLAIAFSDADLTVSHAAGNALFLLASSVLADCLVQSPPTSTVLRRWVEELLIAIGGAESPLLEDEGANMGGVPDAVVKVCMALMTHPLSTVRVRAGAGLDEAELRQLMLDQVEALVQKGWDPDKALVAIEKVSKDIASLRPDSTALKAALALLKGGDAAAHS